MSQDAKPSPFAPAKLPDMPAIYGVRFATREAGIKYKGRTDLLLAVDAVRRGPSEASSTVDKSRA